MDEQLIIRVGDGDRVAYKMLMDRHLRTFLAFANRIVGDRTEAEDIMQEAFLRVWKHAPKWDESRNVHFTSWFYRIVMNLSIDVKRRRKPSQTIDDGFDVTSSEPIADQKLSDKQMAIKLAKALEELPERQRLATNLCYFQGLGNKQAAEILEVRVGAIESLLVRARARLADLLKDQRQEFLKETMS